MVHFNRTTFTPQNVHLAPSESRREFQKAPLPHSIAPRRLSFGLIHRTFDGILVLLQWVLGAFLKLSFKVEVVCSIALSLELSYNDPILPEFRFRLEIFQDKEPRPALRICMIRTCDRRLHALLVVLDCHKMGTV